MNLLNQLFVVEEFRSSSPSSLIRVQTGKSSSSHYMSRADAAPGRRPCRKATEGKEKGQLGVSLFELRNIQHEV
jgi:hypothetical protein